MSGNAVLYAGRLAGSGEDARIVSPYYSSAGGKMGYIEKIEVLGGGKERFDVIDLTGDD